MEYRYAVVAACTALLWGGCGKAVRVETGEVQEWTMSFLEESSRNAVSTFSKEYLQHCSVISVTPEEDNNLYSVVISYPILESLVNTAQNDYDGYRNNVECMKLDNKTSEEIEIFTEQYFISILHQNKYTAGNSNFTVTASLDGYRSVDISSIGNPVETFDFSAVFNGMTDNGTENEDAKVQTLLLGADFVVEEGDNRYLISNLEIKEDSEAIDAINALSTMNNVLVNENHSYYLKYDVTNLATDESADETTVHNGFLVCTEDKKVIETSMSVFGLKSVVSLGAGETKSMTAFLTVPDETGIYWCSADGFIQYKFE